jgi:hypothetical protein
VAVVQKATTEMSADETGPAGNVNIHYDIFVTLNRINQQLLSSGFLMRKRLAGNIFI